jgi:hypothetical protein
MTNTSEKDQTTLATLVHTLETLKGNTAMFISRNEKEQIVKDIKVLAELISGINTELTYLTAKIKVLESAKAEPKPPRKKHTMSPETRAKMSQMMKERHAKYKEEKQNATSISTTSI